MREYKVGVYKTPDDETRYTVSQHGLELFNTDSQEEVLRFLTNVLQ